jgi:hypothetical protein
MGGGGPVGLGVWVVGLGGHGVVCFLRGSGGVPGGGSSSYPLLWGGLVGSCGFLCVLFLVGMWWGSG